MAETKKIQSKDCDHCKYSPGIGYCIIDGPLGKPLPVSRTCDGWVTDDPAVEPEAPVDEGTELPVPSTSSFVSALIDELKERVCAKKFGKVGLNFVIHESMVSKYEWIDSTTVKPENGNGCGE